MMKYVLRGTTVFVTGLALLWSGLTMGMAGKVLAADVLLPGKVTVVKPAKLAKFVSKSEAIAPSVFPLPTPGGADDPTLVGASVRMFDLGGSGGDVTFTLDASGWTGLGNPPGSKGYKYKGKLDAVDLDPKGTCRVVLIKESVVKAVCKGGAVTLVTPFSGVKGVILSIPASTPTTRYCAEFGGTEKKNDGRVMKRKDAGVATSCPLDPPGSACSENDDCDSGICNVAHQCAAPSCGDGVTNGAEACDAGASGGYVGEECWYCTDTCQCTGTECASGDLSCPAGCGKEVDTDCNDSCFVAQDYGLGMGTVTVLDTCRHLEWEVKDVFGGVPFNNFNTLYTWAGRCTEPNPDSLDNGLCQPSWDAAFRCRAQTEDSIPANDAGCTVCLFGVCDTDPYSLGAETTIWEGLSLMDPVLGGGWRIPSLTELGTILDCHFGVPCIDPIFDPTKLYLYWSSTTDADLPDYAWDVSFLGGFLLDGTKDHSSYVRAVRGGL